MKTRRRLVMELRAGPVTIATALAILSLNPPAVAQMAFRHPGVLVNQAQLDYVRAQVNAGTDPWRSAFAKASSSSYGSLSYVPTPWDTVECGPSSNPNYGCSDERNDALAAYTQALLWFITRNDAYAQNSIAIMNAWSSTLTGGHINSNAPLQAGWTGSVWPEAAEIIRYTYSGWSSDDIASFQNMLETQYVPNLINGAPCKNGNWELIMTEALMNISVFNENTDWFNKAVSLWRGRVPAYMYLLSDGPTPARPPGCGTNVYTYWHQSQFAADGLAQETSRDFGHTFWGLAASVNTAETARQQGVDVYSENAWRIIAAFEFHNFINNGGSAPSRTNVGPIGGNGATMEIAYNHFVNRLGNSMPETLTQIGLKRPTGANYFLAWETLTHAQVGNIGLSSASGPIDDATEYFPTYDVQNRTGRSMDDVYGSYVDPSDGALTTWTNVCSGEERTELRWQNWPSQDLTNIEDYDMMFDSDTQRTAISQIKSNTGGEPIYLQVTVPGTIRNDNERNALAEGVDGQWHHWTILFNPATGHGEIWLDYALVRTVERPTASRDWYFKNGTYNNGLPGGYCSTAYFKNFRHFYHAI